MLIQLLDNIVLKGISKNRPPTKGSFQNPLITSMIGYGSAVRVGQRGALGKGGGIH